MIRNYLKIAWRNLVKNKMHSFINIAGLSAGMAVAILIGLWIYSELSFDKATTNHDRIAQVIQNVSNNGEVQTWNNVPFPLADELRKNYGSDFKYVVMRAWYGSHTLTYQDKKMNTPGSYLEARAPDMLSLKMIRGSRSGLTDPASIMLSQSVAKAYFGNADPINKMMLLEGNINVKVTGVYEDIPQNSSFSDLGFMASWQIVYNTQNLSKEENPWRSNSYTLYVQIADNTDMATVSAKIKDAKLKKVRPDELIHKAQLFLYPMAKWHLYSDFKNGVNTGGRIQYVWLFSIVGIFVLLLACINFMNLSTAQSEKRAKEVGIRKAIGSERWQLIGQFFSESLLVVSFAFIIALLIVQLVLPVFNEIAGKQISILWASPLFWLISIGFSLFTGIIAGSYPAFYLSSFNPVRVLKGTFRAGRFAAVPRKVLVVLQFAVSVILIIGTVVVFRQIQFAKNRSLGYSRDGLVMIGSRNDIHKNFGAIKDDLLKKQAITQMAEAGSPPTGVWSTNSGFEWAGKDPGLAVDFPNIDVSYDYGKTVGWKFKDGRDFSREFVSDSAAFVLNETAAKFMGLRHPVGEIIRWDGQPYKVVGVIKDMVSESPYSAVRPTLFHLLGNYAGNILVIKLSPKANVNDALSNLESVFKQYNPSQPFTYQFVDQEFAKKFGDEERVGSLAKYFAILAIFISCLGLFGMASFMAEQRTKEIGVRKVLGASVFTLWRLMSTDFVILVVISLVISLPMAYYFMYGWLQNYQYHAELSWWIFALTCVSAIAITLLTVSYQSIKAALMNPVKSLKTE